MACSSCSVGCPFLVWTHERAIRDESQVLPRMFLIASVLRSACDLTNRSCRRTRLAQKQTRLRPKCRPQSNEELVSSRRRVLRNGVQCCLRIRCQPDSGVDDSPCAGRGQSVVQDTRLLVERGRLIACLAAFDLTQGVLQRLPDVGQ